MLLSIIIKDNNSNTAINPQSGLWWYIIHMINKNNKILRGKNNKHTNNKK